MFFKYIYIYADIREETTKICFDKNKIILLSKSCLKTKLLIYSLYMYSCSEGGDSLHIIVIALFVSSLFWFHVSKNTLVDVILLKDTCLRTDMCFVLGFCNFWGRVHSEANNILSKYHFVILIVSDNSTIV